MKAFIVGTAGHIDHGKTALIRSLTGMDADRLKEEKERGITIDLGFACLLLPEAQIGFIDVPGHERFLHNMLSGIGGIQYLLLTIAADESVMAQTREHFDICRLLGIGQGAVVLTKIDLVDEETLMLTMEEVKELVQGSFLEGAPVFPISNRTGQGIDALKNHLTRTANEIPSDTRQQAARMNVDRVFHRKGFGAVVTGTLLSGTLSREQEIEFLPGRLSSRIRNLQSYGQEVETVRAGRRIAANVHRLEISELHRGMVLAEKDCYEATDTLDVHVELLTYAGCLLKNRSRVHLHIGSEETTARAVLLPNKEIGPGQAAVARLRLERPVVAVHGDRFVLRRFSPPATIGGGMVLHPFPPKRKRGQARLATADPVFIHGAPEEKIFLDLQWSGASGRSPREIGQIFGYSRDHQRDLLRRLQTDGRVCRPIGSEGRVVTRSHLEVAKQKILLALEECHRDHPLSPGIVKEELCQRLFFCPVTDAYLQAVTELLASGQIEVLEGVLCRFGRRVTYNEREISLRQRLEDYYRRRGLQAPRWEEVLEELQESEEQVRYFYQQLLKEGILVRICMEFSLHREALQEALGKIRRRYAKGDAFSVTEFKDLLGLTRKVAIPLLEFLDRQHMTRRMNDRRIWIDSVPLKPS